MITVSKYDLRTGDIILSGKLTDPGKCAENCFLVLHEKRMTPHAEYGAWRITMITFEGMIVDYLPYQMGEEYAVVR